ncbi:MAG: CLI_3235 family bacteriocin precursor [bacterium]|nr:CLI_3235 family bacteriocin precursor [bacterium]
MKKLTKKIRKTEHTLEAYSCNCPTSCTCNTSSVHASNYVRLVRYSTTFIVLN